MNLMLLVAALAAGAVHVPHLGGRAPTRQSETIIAGAPVPRCSTPPAPSAPIPDPPWPQRWFDTAALAGLGDGRGVTVAVIDSGVDALHPQLAHAVGRGRDILDRSGDGRVDCVGHGTAVASIIAARPQAGAGLRGLAPGVRILSIRVSERVDAGGVVSEKGVVSGKGDVADLAAGIRAATASRPKPAVINLSISTTRDDAGLRAAVMAALAADIVVVAAVGNRHEQGDPPPYPAAYDGVVGVGAIGVDGSRVSMSQVGAYVDLVAPGDDVVCAVPGGGHRAFQGTSVAVPFVTAAAALVRARWPGLSQVEVVRRLLATADPAAGARPSDEYGHGVVNPVRALTEIVPPPDRAVDRAPEAAIAPPPREPDSRPVPGAVVGAAAVLALVSAALAMLAPAARMGRRRSWRPGRVDPIPRYDVGVHRTGETP